MGGNPPKLETFTFCNIDLTTLHYVSTHKYNVRDP